MPTALQNINNFCEIFKLYLAAVFLTLKKKKNKTQTFHLREQYCFVHRRMIPAWTNLALTKAVLI